MRGISKQAPLIGTFMNLSSKTKDTLLAPFAISHIMQRFWLPGLVGFLLLAVGVWQRVTWLKVAGIILAAPVIWVYAVVIFVFFSFALFDHVRQRLKNSHRAASGIHPDDESHHAG